MLFQTLQENDELEKVYRLVSVSSGVPLIISPYIIAIGKTHRYYTDMQYIRSYLNAFKLRRTVTKKQGKVGNNSFK